MKCPNCNRRYLNSYKFCPHCGTKRPEPKICPICEHEYFVRKACPKCRVKLVEKEEYIQKKSEKSVNYKEKGRDLEKLGKYEEAICYYNNAKDLNPDDFFILKNMANCFYHLNAYNEALGCLDEVIEFCKSNLHYDLKGIDSEFRHLLKYNPERCIEKKIEILEEIGSYEEAFMACDELINMIPSEENFLKKMELLRKLGKNEEIDLIYKDMANKGNI
ncbi:tetratricopeptide repeat protein [uncultured Methanobrevibacter sp.]|uniref:tetratricopeptide repeat protein n=1 Tax=uncultured Methanobrevibacter sp. TaxID=253161 RepID=UPI0025F1D6DF|nr:hypothetical protein [uncultured Methanobrevibacter sp.]